MFGRALSGLKLFAKVISRMQKWPIILFRYCKGTVIFCEFYRKIYHPGFTPSRDMQSDRENYSIFCQFKSKLVEGEIKCSRSMLIVTTACFYVVTE